MRHAQGHAVKRLDAARRALAIRLAPELMLPSTRTAEAVGVLDALAVPRPDQERVIRQSARIWLAGGASDGVFTALLKVLTTRRITNETLILLAYQGGIRVAIAPDALPRACRAEDR